MCTALNNFVASANSLRKNPGEAKAYPPPHRNDLRYHHYHFHFYRRSPCNATATHGIIVRITMHTSRVTIHTDN